MVTNLVSNALASSASPALASSSTSSTKDAAGLQDRFLKLLVAQLNNQDPLNPTDNAQLTSQLAQIQQVQGLSTLDTSIKSIGGQLGQLQALQSVSLVGHNVSVPGNRLQISNGLGRGSFELDKAASNVKLEILGPAGNVLDTVALGAQGAGRQDFQWPADKIDPAADIKFRITATQGAGAVASTPYAKDRVVAVNNQGGNLRLQLQNLGIVDYANVASID